MKIEKKNLMKIIYSRLGDKVPSGWRIFEKKTNCLILTTGSLFHRYVNVELKSSWGKTESMSDSGPLWRIETTPGLGSLCFNAYLKAPFQKQEIEGPFPFSGNLRKNTWENRNYLEVYSQTDLDAISDQLLDQFSNAFADYPAVDSYEELDIFIGELSGFTHEKLAIKYLNPELPRESVVDGFPNIEYNGYATGVLPIVYYKALLAKLLGKDFEFRFNWLKDVLSQPIPDLTGIYGEKWQQSFESSQIASRRTYQYCLDSLERI